MKFELSEKVLTPDGIGRIESMDSGYIEGEYFATCLLQKPFRYIDNHSRDNSDNNKEFFPPYTFGYRYNFKKLKKLKTLTKLNQNK